MCRCRACMKRVPVEGGEDLYNVCHKLIKEAPAFAIFNDVRIECQPGDTPQDLLQLYNELAVCRDIHDS